MDGNEHVGAVAVIEFDHLLRFAVHRGCHQPAELSDTMIAMHDVVAYLQLVDLAEGDDRLSASRVLTRHRHAVVALKNLMIGVAADLQSLIHKPFVQGGLNADEGYWLLALSC